MSRAERRRTERTKVKTYTLTDVQINEIKKNAVNEAIDKSFILMLSLPVMVVHDHFKDLWKKEVDGKCREERFMDYVLDLYDSFLKDYITFDDLIDTIQEETGLNIEVYKHGA